MTALQRAFVACCAALLPLSARAQRTAGRPASTGASGWQLDTSRNEMTDEFRIILMLDAATVSGPRVTNRPVLAVHCTKGNLFMAVMTQTALEVDNGWTTVRMRWGTDPAEPEERWAAPDGTGAVVPDPELLLSELLNFPDLKFEFHVANEASRVATFNARGLSRHMRLLRKTCPEPAPTPVPAGNDSAAFGQAFEEMHVELVAFVLAEERYKRDHDQYTKSVPDLEQTLAELRISRTYNVDITVDDIMEYAYRLHATHRLVHGWVCGVYVGRIAPYRKGQEPGEWQCWKA